MKLAAALNIPEHGVSKIWRSINGLTNAPVIPLNGSRVHPRPVTFWESALDEMAIATKLPRNHEGDKLRLETRGILPRQTGWVAARPLARKRDQGGCVPGSSGADQEKKTGKYDWEGLFSSSLVPLESVALENMHASRPTATAWIHLDFLLG